uniref:Glycoside hydrolase n=2 Tax=viral metagenome TaxID=1070528 RepID=A0A6M3IGS5_9ZZZZ
MTEIRYPYGGKPTWEHTAIGLHLKPAEHHTDWLGDAETRAYELGVLKRIRAGWATMMTGGDSAIEVIAGKEAVRWLLDEQIVPIFRDSTGKLPYPYPNIKFVEKLVPIYAEYGLRPLVIPWNEPGDDREWAGGEVPPDWKERFLPLWIDAAKQITNAGANVAFPDPLSEWQWWFERFPADIMQMFRDGRAVVAAHLYGKNRPVNYPYDDVSQNGTPLTEAEWRAALGNFWDVPGYREVTLEYMNQQRRELAWLGKTFHDDATCFGAWRNIYYAAEQAWGFRPVMCMTEGGWTPKDIPGSGPNNDYRWPVTTPAAIRDHTRQVLETQSEHGMFALTFWICYGWSYDGWYRNPLAGIHYDCFEYPRCYEQPVIHSLEDAPILPGPTPGENLWGEVRAEFEALRALIAES